MSGAYSYSYGDDGFVSINATNIKANINEVIVQEASIGPDTAKALIAVLTPLADELVQRIRSKASNDILRIKSGRFVRSIGEQVESLGQESLGQKILSAFSRFEDMKLDMRDQGVFAIVGSSDWKAHILEVGATIPPHAIDPKTAHALRFLAREGITFAGHVNWPGATIAPHPTVHAAYAEMEPRILAAIENVATQG